MEGRLEAGREGRVEGGREGRMEEWREEPGREGGRRISVEEGVNGASGDMEMKSWWLERQANGKVNLGVCKAILLLGTHYLTAHGNRSGSRLPSNMCLRTTVAHHIPYRGGGMGLLRYTYTRYMATKVLVHNAHRSVGESIKHHVHIATAYRGSFTPRTSLLYINLSSHRAARCRR